MRLGAGLAAGVAADGRSIDVADAAGAVAVTLTFAVPGEPVAGFEPDDGEVLLLEGDGVRSRLRCSLDSAALTVQLTVDNLTEAPVGLPYLGLGVSVGTGRSGWSWTTDLDGFIAVSPGPDRDAGVLVRLRQGFLRVARDQPVFGASPGSAEGVDGQRRGAYHLSPPGSLLGPFRRHVVTLEVTVLAALEDALGVLPGWLPDVVVPAGAFIELSLPDRAAVPGPGVTATQVDTDLVLAGEPGHRRVAVHGPRGIERVRLCWAPDLAELLPAVVDRLLGRPRARASDAAGFVVADAVARGLVRDRERALDWLDRVDWLDRDTLLGDATAGLLAALQREVGQLDEAWRQVAERPVAPGFGLVVMRLSLASLALAGELPESAGGLLRRPTDDSAAELELALLGGSPVEALDAGLAGLVDALGDRLPGRPVGLSASEAAYAISLLRLCPERWERSQDAAAAAVKAERLLLADHASVDADEGGQRPELDGLAWLLLGELGI